MNTRLLIVFIVATLALLGSAHAATTKSGYIASPSQELLEKAISYLIAKDEAAFNKLLDAGMVIPLKAGLEVEIVDTKILKGLVKIRPRGEVIELWTNIEAVQQ